MTSFKIMNVKKLMQNFNQAKKVRWLFQFYQICNNFYWQGSLKYLEAKLIYKDVLFHEVYVSNF